MPVKQGKIVHLKRRKMEKLSVKTQRPTMELILLVVKSIVLRPRAIRIRIVHGKRRMVNVRRKFARS